MSTTGCPGGKINMAAVSVVRSVIFKMQPMYNSLILNTSIGPNLRDYNWIHPEKHAYLAFYGWEQHRWIEIA